MEVKMTLIHYAIGDIHGRDDLLEKLHDRIAAFHEMFHGEQSATLIHLGDYIDGGPDSCAVIDRLMADATGFDTVCLKGNHEDLMLECLQSDDRQVWWNWLSNGGDATLSSLGLSFRHGGYDHRQLAGALGTERITWLKSLPLHYVADDYLFVHAGIRPGWSLEEQEEQDLLWIRGRFLESSANHGCRVIHGHTPMDEPEVRTNRIGIDTGATSNGRLTAVVLFGREAEEEPKFLFAED
jgi:serine/threonine protein phosphatase 1